jgi:hypothetical protein
MVDVSSEIWNEHFNHDLRVKLFDGPDGSREMIRASISEIVAVNGGNDNVP